jgi:hypothetical protein
VTRQGASADFQVCKGLLNPLGNLFRDLPALGYAIALDVFAYSHHGGKITLRDRPALGAAELFDEPLRHPVSGIHTPVELINPFIKGISTSRHPDDHSNDSQGAVFDFT